MRVLKGFTQLFLLTVVLIGWGMSDAMAGGGFTGGGGGGGGFTGRPLIKIEITADKTTLPVNITNQLSNSYLSTFYVKVTQDGNVYLAPTKGITVTVASGLSTGALYYLDGDKAHQTCTTPVGSTTEVCVENAYRSIALPRRIRLALFPGIFWPAVRQAPWY